MTDNSEYEKCKKCFGAGQHLCPICQGRHVLSRKDAYTVVLCKNCMSGRVKCKACMGTGKVRTTEISLNSSSSLMNNNSNSGHSPRSLFVPVMMNPSAQQHQLQQRQSQQHKLYPSQAQQSISQSSLTNNHSSSGGTGTTGSSANNSNYQNDRTRGIDNGNNANNRELIVMELQKQIQGLRQQLTSQQEQMNQLIQQNTLLLESNSKLTKIISDYNMNENSKLIRDE